MNTGASDLIPLDGPAGAFPSGSSILPVAMRRPDRRADDACRVLLASDRCYRVSLGGKLPAENKGSKMRMLLAVLFAASILGSGAAAGETALLKGPGAQTCATFAKNYKADPTNETFYFAWATGYMSGLNSTLFDQKLPYRNLAGKPIQAQQAFIRVFCDRRPQVSYLFAVRDLYKALPIVPVPGGRN